MAAIAMITVESDSLSTRTMTGYNKKQNGNSGTVPEYGAIFMSNTSTKEECFSLKLFGLPSSLVSFVKEVKDGMILFLFEFEKRELHGVFRASCDGAVNIVPHAYRSSGKQFPAQVKFTQIWQCEPLSEAEFRDALIDNYFSSKKFNFGLSEEQVYRLLLLFSSKKINRLPERQSTISGTKSLTQYSSGKPRRSIDEGSFTSMDRAEAVYDANNYHEHDGGLASADCERYFPKPCNELELVKSQQCKVDCLENFGRVDDDWSRASGGVQMPRQSNTAEYPQYTLSNARSGASGSRFGTSDANLGNGREVGNGAGQPISPDYLSLYPSSSSDSGCSSNPRLDSGNTFKDQLRSPFANFRPIEPQFSNCCNYQNDVMVRSSPSCHSVEPPFPTLPYSTSHQGATVTACETCHLIKQPFSNLDNAKSLSYDPDAPGINIGVLSSPIIGHNSGLAQECAPRPCHNYTGNFLSSLKSQTFPTGLDSNPFPNNHESSYCRTKVPPSIASMSENSATKFSANEGDRHSSFPKPSLGSMLYSESGNRGRDNKKYSSYSLTPSYKNHPFTSGYGFPAVHDRDGNKNEPLLCEKREAFVASVPSSNDNECWKQDCAHSAEREGVGFHEYVSVNYGVINSQGSQNMRSDYPMERKSVFSRLSLAQQVYEEQNNAFDNDANDMDMSIDEVMAIPLQNQRVKAKKSKLVTKEFDDVENNRKRKTTSCPKLGRVCLAIISNDTRMNNNSTKEKREEETPFFNFKRRSQVQKIEEETESRSCVESTENGALSGRQHKRRKLIRPDFSKIVSSYDKPANNSSVQNLQMLSGGSSVIKDINVGCETLGDIEVKEDRSSQHVERPHNTCSISCEGNNCKMEVGSHCEVERQTNSFEGKGVEDERSSQGGVILGFSHPVSEEVHDQNAEIGVLTVEPNFGGTTRNNLLQEEKTNELFPTSGEMTIGGSKIKSSNLNPDSESIPEKVLNVCVNEECNAKCSWLTSLSVNKQIRASAESIRCSPVQEIAQEICDNNIRNAEVLIKGSGNCETGSVQKVENGNELLSRQMTSWKNDAVLEASEGVGVAEASQNAHDKNVGDAGVIQAANEVLMV